MNLNFDTLVQAQFEHNTDLKWEAAHYRIMYGKIDGKYPMRRNLSRMMLWIGNWFVSIGEGLKNKYDFTPGISRYPFCITTGDES